MPESSRQPHTDLEQSTNAQSWRRFLLPLVFLVLLAAIAGALASVGMTVKTAGLLVLIERAIGGGGFALLWCVGALGLGRLAAPLFPRKIFGWSLQLACGLAIALFVAHLMGASGAYSLPIQRWINGIPMMVGIVVLILQLRTRNITSESLTTGISPWVVLLIPALALLWVGVSNPPGALWLTEAHGYDVLSYHLQLPREWLTNARISTLEHNVYSALPSYMEAAFAQLAGMSPWGARLSTGAAMPLYSAQALHAGFALATALLIARLARECIPTAPAFTRIIGTALFLSTPWIVVTATSAYNEMGVCACFAGALLSLRIVPLHPTARGLIVGALLGVACGCKPTAFFMCAIPVAAAAAVLLPRKHWVPAGVGAAFAGLFVLSPWLVRNWIDTGNPVFPFATGSLGSGHWSVEQAARWQQHHTFSGTLSDRFSLLFSADRGLLHPQWSITFGVALLSCFVGIAHRSTRWCAVAMGVTIAAQLTAWLFVGHLQSRFMIPVLVPACVLASLACAALTSDRPAIVAGTARLAFTLAVLLAAAASMINLLAQRDANPNIYLIGGAEQLNGSTLRDDLLRLSQAEREAVYNNRSPETYINLELAQDSANKLYLIGDSTPLYFDLPVVYHTTWDTSPLIEALDRGGWSLPVAVDLLREQGITHILINFAELMRLRESGYLDPRMGEELANALTHQAAIIRQWIGPNRYSILLDLNQPPTELPAGDDHP